MAARLFPSNRQPQHNEDAIGNEPSALPSLSSSHFSTQQEFHAYLHNKILENITYYKALARYRQRRRKYIVYRNGRQYKNLRLFYRLTESGLCLLRTQYAKKPKNPI